MKPRFTFWTLGLGAALLAVSCAPAASTEVVAPSTLPTENSQVIPTPTAKPSLLSDPTLLPPFTPHGDELVATDPTTVVLASGDLQLVEFFRFT